MVLRIPVELLAWNNGGGSASGNGGNGTGGSNAGGGSGGAGDGGSGSSDGKTGEGGAGDGDGSGSGDGDDSKPAGKTFTQAELDDIVKRRLADERKAAEKRTDREKTEAAAQALKDNSKFEELATQRERDLVTARGELETVTAERDALKTSLETANGAIGQILATQRKDLPGHITDLLDKMEPAEQLGYLAKHAESIRKGATQSIPNHSGNTGTGAGSGTGAGGAGGNGYGGLAQSFIGATYGQRKQESK